MNFLDQQMTPLQVPPALWGVPVHHCLPICFREHPQASSPPFLSPLPCFLTPATLQAGFSLWWTIYICDLDKSTLLTSPYASIIVELLHEQVLKFIRPSNHTDWNFSWQQKQGKVRWKPLTSTVLFNTLSLIFYYSLHSQFYLVQCLFPSQRQTCLRTIDI